MECDLCAEDFDCADRLPKVLVPCGHTACLQCLLRLPDRRCPTCRRDFNGPPPELPTNFTVLQLLEGVRLERSPCGWCPDCRTAATPRCWEDHDVLSVRRALRRQLQDAQPQADEQIRCLRDDQALAALTLLTGETWEVTLRGGGRELTGTLGHAEDPAKKMLRLLLAAALTEDRAAAPDSPPAADSQPPAISPPPAAETLPQREMDVAAISGSVRDAQQQEKAAALRDAPGVTRLVGLRCDADPAWSLQLLQLAGPTVEQLSVYRVSATHLNAVHAMPRLRRMEMMGGDFAPNAFPLLSELPGSHAGLQWLRVGGLPRATTHSLLLAHARSLQSLQLFVGSSEPWKNCQDLAALLEQCGLRALVRLVLRGWCGGCDRWTAEWRKALPGREVVCCRASLKDPEVF